MTIATRTAKVTTPIEYAKPNGKTGYIPIGPCLIELVNDDCIDVVWGARGQISTTLPNEQVVSAAKRGDLVFLD
jgi:hypothetical protein